MGSLPCGPRPWVPFSQMSTKDCLGVKSFSITHRPLEHQQFSLISPPSSPDKGYPSFISQANSSMFSHDLIILPLFAVLSLTIFLLNIIFTLFTGPLPGQICFQSQSSLLDIENNSSLHLLFFQYFFFQVSLSSYTACVIRLHLLSLL